jgi:hypothetical protein
MRQGIGQDSSRARRVDVEVEVSMIPILGRQQKGRALSSGFASQFLPHASCEQGPPGIRIRKNTPRPGAALRSASFRLPWQRWCIALFGEELCGKALRLGDSFDLYCNCVNCLLELVEALLHQDDVGSFASRRLLVDIANHPRRYCGERPDHSNDDSGYYAKVCYIRIHDDLN